MRRALILVPLLALTACETPREACISSVTYDLNVVNDLIETSRANLQRGYGIEERQEIRTVPYMCSIEHDDGSETEYPCDRTETYYREVPVAIDLQAEQAQLDQLLAQQQRLSRQSSAAIQQCIAVHPE